MFNQPCIRAIDSNTVNLAGVISEIFDVSQDMAFTVLADEVSEMCTEAHVCHGRFWVAPLAHGEAFEEDEAFAVEQLIADRSQKAGEPR